VVCEGLAEGFKLVVELRPEDGVHKYDPADAFATIVYTSPAIITASGPALAVAPGNTVTLKELCAVQFGVLAVTVYMVVVCGENTGLALDALLTPAVGDHVNEVPVETTPRVKEAPRQIVVSSPALAVIAPCNTIETGVVAMLHDEASRAVTVYDPGCRLVNTFEF
jgi:hypothetical protein